jgi:hypothetical protein
MLLHTAVTALPAGIMQKLYCCQARLLPSQDTACHCAAAEDAEHIVKFYVH